MAKDNLRWLVLLVQLPASPSSARVALWRRLRTVGASSVMQGAWALPFSEAHRSLLAAEVELIEKTGGSAALLIGEAVAGTDGRSLKERFRADRAREYDEFAERANALLAEIAKETRARKFTFAEFEEVEDDFRKLQSWLVKIAARDFFPDKRRADARNRLRRCETALHDFAQKVYRADGATATE